MIVEDLGSSRSCANSEFNWISAKHTKHHRQECLCLEIGFFERLCSGGEEGAAQVGMVFKWLGAVSCRVHEVG